MNELPESIIRTILIEEMTLPTADIWLRDQNVDIPNDDGLYIVVGAIDENIISNTSQSFAGTRPTPGAPIDPNLPDMTEIQEVRLKTNIQIDILSRSVASLTRRWEVVAALASVTSRQAQEDNSFSIFAVPTSFVNTSATEGGSKINKFSITLSAHAWFRKEIVLQSNSKDYYETFDARVDDKDTAGQPDGLIEFTL